MIELVETLDKAGTLLCSALDKYLGACSAIQNHYQQTNALTGVPRALAERVVSELALVTSCEAKIRQARSTISQAVNISSIVAPINSLPSEILIRIFHLVVNTRPCDLKYHGGAKVILPNYPEFLSHVCTRWRQIVRDSPSLWSHIDIVPFNCLNQAFKTRAEASISRAGDSLLDIHLYEPELYNNFDHEGVIDFFAIAAPRMRSLELVAPDISNWVDDSVLDFCFGNCTVGTFTELTIASSSAGDSIFIEATYDPDFLSTNVWLNVPPEDLEALLAPVIVLRLDGVFLPWCHPVYRGLVELRLVTTRKRPTQITELEVVNILRSSPNLRVLQFGLKITDLLDDSPLFPVHLSDLEILDSTPMQRDQLGTFLRLLAPGPKPLQFSFSPHIPRNGSSVPPHEDKIEGFLTRSNVTRIHVKGLPNPPDINLSSLLSPLPGLRVLALDSFQIGRRPHSTPDPRELKQFSPHPRPLDALYVIDSLINLDDLEEVIKHHQVRKVVFWRCGLTHDDEWLSDYELVKKKLSVSCPFIECLGKEEPNPIEHWS